MILINDSKLTFIDLSLTKMHISRLKNLKTYTQSGKEQRKYKMYEIRTESCKEKKKNVLSDVMNE